MRLWLTIGLILTALAGGLIVVLTSTTSSTTMALGAGNGSCRPLPQLVEDPNVELTEEQLGNAVLIIQVGRELSLPPYGQQIAVATAMQESRLRNLDHGDRDSLGLFQQRPSMGWGTREQILDPRYATTTIYIRLQQVPGWQQMQLWEAAQAVQRSAFPLAYQQWAQLAADLVQRYGGGLTCTTPGGPRRTGHPIRHRADRQTLPLGRHRPQRLRLLRTRPPSLGSSRRRAQPHQPRTMAQRRPLPSRPSHTRRSAVLELRRHPRGNPPRRHVPRRRHHHRSPAIRRPSPHQTHHPLPRRKGPDAARDPCPRTHPGPTMSTPRPRRLLTQNREMKAIGVWNWTLPAWAGRLPDGRTYNTCPSAGICAQACYARHGTYAWPVVKAKHEANLAFVLDDTTGWENAMLAELAAPKFRGGWVRIHDSGDFFSDRYLTTWLRIYRTVPDTTFYCYTKEVNRFRRLVEPNPPPNFLWAYSYGGTQDNALDPEVDRVADVFPGEAAIDAAGWSSQEESDLLAVLGPRLVGIPANRIPHVIKMLAGRTFREWQQDADAEREAQRRRRQFQVITSPPIREQDAA